jgi:hypothetical protein
VHNVQAQHAPCQACPGLSFREESLVKYLLSARLRAAPATLRAAWFSRPVAHDIAPRFCSDHAAKTAAAAAAVVVAQCHGEGVWVATLHVFVKVAAALSTAGHA